MILPTVDAVIARMRALGLKVFDGPTPYDLNLVGLRVLPGTPNAFDDVLFCFYRPTRWGAFVGRAWPITTDPGRPSLTDPRRADGTAIVVHDRQYRGVWTFGSHKGQYECLVPTDDSIFHVWRDRGTDGAPTYGGPVYRNATGIQLHHAGTDSPLVERWSEGCQVLKRTDDFAEVMKLAHQQEAAGFGRTFTYTLLGWPGT